MPQHKANICTYHEFFGLGPCELTLERILEACEKRDVQKRLKCLILILDEAYRMSRDLFEMLDIVLTRYPCNDQEKPFGGRQVLGTLSLHLRSGVLFDCRSPDVLTPCSCFFRVGILGIPSFRGPFTGLALPAREFWRYRTR